LEEEMIRDAAINVRTFPTIRDAVDKAAASEGRTRAQWVERLLVRDLQERGFLPPDQPTHAPTHT
jgi:hypothetical protein